MPCVLACAFFSHGTGTNSDQRVNSHVCAHILLAWTNMRARSSCQDMPTCFGGMVGPNRYALWFSSYQACQTNRDALIAELECQLIASRRDML